MRRSEVMFAIPSPGEVAPIEVDKICRLTAGLGAELEIFHCIYDPDAARPGRFGTNGRSPFDTWTPLRRRDVKAHAETSSR